MNDTELSECIVALGVLEYAPRIPDMLRIPSEPHYTMMYADQAVRDPRVAMALMEKLPQESVGNTANVVWRIFGGFAFVEVYTTERTEPYKAEHESFYHAVTEACVLALEKNDG